MTFRATPTELDDILAAFDAPPPPRPRRTLLEFLSAFDRGDASGFFLDDFEEHERAHLARCFGLIFLDGSLYRASVGS